MFVTLLLLLAAPAASLNADDPALEQCLRQPTGDDPLPQIRQCYQDAFTRAGAEVEQRFAGMLERMRADGVPTREATAARQSWLQFRDRWCRVEGVGDPDPAARSLTELQCRTELTQRFLARVRSAYQR